MVLASPDDPVVSCADVNTTVAADFTVVDFPGDLLVNVSDVNIPFASGVSNIFGIPAVAGIHAVVGVPVIFVFPAVTSCPASSGKEKTKCGLSHPLRWPCVSDLLTSTLKGES